MLFGVSELWMYIEKPCAGQIRSAVNQLICVYPSALPSSGPQKDKEENLSSILSPLFEEKVEQTSVCVYVKLTVSGTGTSLFV